MPKKEAEYVMHDGAMIRLDTLVSMAKQAGSYQLAEHYIVSIMYHAAVTGQTELASLCNEIRAHYHLMALPGGPPASAQNMPKRNDVADIVRRKFEAMSSEQQRCVIHDSLRLLWRQHHEQFINKRCWMGIYMVMQYRLKDRLKMTHFTAIIAEATPEEWPVSKRISKSTMSNFARDIPAELRDEPYNSMGSQNPWSVLCDRYWDILQQVILSAE